jgi:ketosteroid isomerase-like protein
MADTETVRAFFDAFARRDEEALVALCHPGVRFEPVSTEMAERPAYVGREGMRRYLRDLDATWERFTVTLHSVHKGDRTVVALGRVYAATKGFIGDDPVGVVCGVRRGKLLWGKVYTSQDAALAAAGLSRDGDR